MELGPLQKEFIKNLRSGEFKQGFTELYNSCTDCYCVLGVGAITAGNKKEDINFRSLLNITTRKELGLVDVLGSSRRNALSLSALNDLLGDSNIKGKTFAEIADILENNPEEYFTESK